MREASPPKSGNLTTSRKEHATNTNIPELARLQASLEKAQQERLSLQAELTVLKAQLLHSNQAALPPTEPQSPPRREAADHLAKFQRWAKAEAPRVLKMQEPLTASQLETLTKEYSLPAIQELCLAMHNHVPLLLNNRSANLTIRAWFKRRRESAGQTLPSSPLFTQAEKIHRQSQPIH